jgi:hypothetical protein
MARESAQAFRQNATGFVSISKRSVHGYTSVSTAQCTPRPATATCP